MIETLKEDRNVIISEEEDKNFIEQLPPLPPLPKNGLPRILALSHQLELYKKALS